MYPYPFNALIECCFKCLLDGDKLMEKPEIQAAYVFSITDVFLFNDNRNELGEAFEALCHIISQATVTVNAFLPSAPVDLVPTILRREHPGFSQQFLADLQGWAKLRISAGLTEPVYYFRKSTSVTDEDIITDAYKFMREGRFLYLSRHDRCERLLRLMSEKYNYIPICEIEQAVDIIDEARKNAEFVAESITYRGTFHHDAIKQLQEACPKIDQETLMSLLGTAMHDVIK